MVYLIIKIFIVLTLLLGMVLLSCGIHNFLGIKGELKNESASKLKKDIRNSAQVISDNSIFHNFIMELENYRLRKDK